MPLPVYLDHHATTPCDPAVLDAMLPWFTDHFGNSGSTVHAYGVRAKAGVDIARKQVASALGAQPEEIIFTSGATESDNLAVLGVADALGGTAHAVTVASEHKAVLEPMQALAERGWDVTVLRPGPDGRVEPQQVADALRDDTRLVSVMLANNEIGVLQPLAAIAAVCREAGVLCHTDAVQAMGWLPVDVTTLGVDLMSISAHKMYGPKGVGALWVRRGLAEVHIGPRQLGGGQERGIRPGTVPVPLVVGLGAAAKAADAHARGDGPSRVAALRDHLADTLIAVGGVAVTGSRTHRLPHNLHVTVDGVRSKDLFQAVRTDVACSAGSACSTGKATPSHVLTALGLDAETSQRAVRFGLGRSTTEEDVARAGEALVGAIRRIRKA